MLTGNSYRYNVLSQFLKKKKEFQWKINDNDLQDLAKNHISSYKILVVGIQVNVGALCGSD